MARSMLVLLGSACVCEQTFSVMNINKAAADQSQLSNTTPHIYLGNRQTKLSSDFNPLAKKQTSLLSFKINAFYKLSCNKPSSRFVIY